MDLRVFDVEAGVADEDGAGRVYTDDAGRAGAHDPGRAGTNQLTNASYDLNGNMFSGAGVTLTYDEANRVTSATPTSGGTEYYGYAPDNKRIYRLTPQSGGGSTEAWTFYGAQGERLQANMQLIGPLEVYNPQGQLTGWRYSFQGGTSVVWFAGKMVSDGNTAFQDRLGTNRAGGARFRPYGEEISSTSNDRVKFATYTRDSFSGLDYADQRFYASGYGRFATVDPYRRSAKRGLPGSWNRYAYAGSDPANRYDPTGLVDWGKVLTGVGLVVAGGTATGGAVAGEIGSVGVGTAGAIGLSLIGAQGISMGFGNIVAGFTAPGSQVLPSVAQGLDTAGQITQPGGLLLGALSGGNPTAIQVGAAVTSTMAAGASILSISEVENMTGLALTLGSISSDVNEMNQNLSVFVQGAPTSITVTSPGIYIQPVPSQISLPDTLTASGGGGGVDPRTGFDPGDDDSN